VAFSSSAAALALVVLLPTAALACPDQGGSDGSGGSGHSQGENRQSDHAKASKSHDTQGGAESDSRDAKKSKDSDSKDAKGNGGKDAKNSDTATSGAGSGGTQDGHNPPGNNGTIKIDYAAPADSGHANRPHPGCAFQLRMFNFDANQYGTITFVGQAPTKLGTLLTQQHMLLSNDAAGGGQDVDEVYAYTAQQLGLIGKPQAKQGWHVKVSVDADNAPGGAKHKVFWLKCDETPAPAAGTSNSAGTTTATGGTTQTTQGAGTAQTSVPAQTTTGTTVPGTTTTSTTSATTAGAATAAGNGAAANGFTGGGGTAAVTPAAPATRSAVRPSALAFTGFALGTLIVLALGILAAGFLAIRAGRRRGGAQL
jgi:hypothetical protein